jgi:endonuclease-3
MPKETFENKRKRAKKILGLLKKQYPDARCELDFSTPLDLLVATILSAQCTDNRVNIVTKELFRKYRTPEDYLEVPLEKFEEEIRSTGFFRNKAKNIRGACRLMIEKLDAKVPRTMEEMLELPGVARKTANVVLAHAYNVVEGIAVDTHVKRLSQRLGFTQNNVPDKIEADVCALVPKKDWGLFSDLLIFHGRRVCFAVKPSHDECCIRRLCPSKNV